MFAESLGLDRRVAHRWHIEAAFKHEAEPTHRFKLRAVCEGVVLTDSAALVTALQK